MADKEFLSPVTLAVLKLKNTANTFTNLFSNATTAARTWTLPDKSGTFAMLDDVLSTTLTGLSASAGTLLSTDSILQAFNKIAGLVDNNAWTAFTPAFTGFSLGNGTATGRYNTIGKTVMVSCIVTIGSTSSFGASFNFEYTNLPAPIDNRSELSNVTIRDTSTGNNYPCTKTFKQIVCYGATSNYLVYAAITSTVPFVWASGDNIYINLLYETQ